MSFCGTCGRGALASPSRKSLRREDLRTPDHANPLELNNSRLEVKAGFIAA